MKKIRIRLLMNMNILPMLFFLGNNLSAQNFFISTLGSVNNRKDIVVPIAIGKGYLDVTSTGSTKFGYTAKLSKMKMTATILAFDDKINLTKEIPLADGKEVYGPFPPFVMRITNKPFFVYQNYNDDLDAIEIYAALIDSLNYSIGAAKKILTVSQRNVGLMGMMSMYSNHRFVITSSPDNSKALFLWYPGDKNVITWAIVDKNMDNIKTETTTINEVTKLMVNNCFLDNEGNFFLGYTYRRVDDYYSGIFKADKNGRTTSKEITFSDGRAGYIYVVEDPKSTTEIKVIGLSTRNADGFNLSGCFWGNVDKSNLNFSSIAEKQFSEELLEKFHDDGYADNKKRKFGIYPDMQLDFISFDDGTIIATGDPRIHMENSSGFGGPVVGPSLLLIFQKEGIQTIRIPKTEKMGIDKGHNSFLHKYMDKAILFYPDLPSNLEKPLSEGETTHLNKVKKGVMVAAVIEKNGTITRRIVNIGGEDKFYFEPIHMKSLDEQTLLFPLERDKVGMNAIKTSYQYYTIKISN